MIRIEYGMCEGSAAQPFLRRLENGKNPHVSYEQVNQLVKAVFFIIVEYW